MLEKVKTLLFYVEDDKDDLFNQLIDICKLEALTFTHLEDLDETLESVVALMVVESYNKLGSEGISSTNYSGVSTNYIDGYSDRVKKALFAKRKLRTI